MSLKKIAVAAVMVLCLTSITMPANAAEASNDPALASLDEGALAAALADENLDLRDLSVESDGFSLTTASELGDGSNLVTEAVVDTTSNTLTLNFSSDNPDVDGSSLVIEIQKATTSEREFTAIDPETSEEVQYDSNDGEFAVLPVVIALGLVGIADAILYALLLTVAVVVVAGVLYYAAAKAIEAIKKGSQFNHFRALRSGSQLLIGTCMSLNEAIYWGRGAKDTWSTTQAGAYAVAAGVSNKPAVGPEIDASGSPKYYHYHPYSRIVAMHAFYGTAR